jgi:hypothetical protein
MSIQATWPRATRLSAEEKLLRDIFSYIGVDPERAENATLCTMVERYAAARNESARHDAE